VLPFRTHTPLPREAPPLLDAALEEMRALLHM
jgi:hypothetical protein